MPHHLPERTLAGLGELLTERTGMYFPRDRWNDLERGIINAANELGFKDVHACIDYVLLSPLTKTELEILASHVTVGETYFFREPQSFAALERHILADLIRKRRGNDQSLRIWSAGCATGEEPYSLAILLYGLLPDIDDWHISILATDINPRFLRKAEQGVYSKWSFRGTPDRLKERYFTTGTGERFHLHPQIKRMVHFSYLNLAEDIYPALENGTNAMDLILCRNVLMYFSTSRARQAINKLHRCLVDGGLLTVSAVETSHSLFPVFEPVNLEGLTFYRRADGYAKPLPAQEFEVAATSADFRTAGSGSSVPEMEVDLPAFNETALPPPETTLRPEPAPSETDPFEEAYALFRSGQYSKAIDKMTAQLSGFPQDTHTIELLARCLANNGRLAEAGEWCAKAIGNDKLNAGCHYLLATIQQEQGLTDNAMASLKRALYLDPTFILAHFALGNLARMRGNTKESGKHFKNALVLIDKCQPGDILPESEGMTARRLREIIEAVTVRQEAA